MPAASDDDAVQPGGAVDKFDLEIVAFFVCWAPYGGPPEDECVPRFGMAADRLRRRLCHIVRHGDRGHVGADDLALLERAATLPVIDEAEPPHRVIDRTPPIGKPVLRQGVWRWV